MTSFVLCGRGKVGSREGRGCSSRGSEHQSLLGCTAPLAPVQSTRVQGVPWACKGWHGRARDAAGLQGVLQVCTVLWVGAVLRWLGCCGCGCGCCGCARHRGCARGCACAQFPGWLVPGGPHCGDPTSRARAVSPDQAPHRLWVCGSTLGWRELRGDPEILGSERPGSAGAGSRIPPVPGDRGISE